ncbi:unnamed protein product, partial [Symbiodinium necroappetens]
EVADVFQRCIDEIKFVLDQRQLEDDEISRTLLRGEDVLELLVVTQQIPQFDGSIPAVEQLSTLSSSMEYQIDAATHLRKILSVERDPPSRELASLLSLIKLAGPDDPFQIPRLPPMYFEVLAPDLPLSSLQSMSDVLWASLVSLGGATATHAHADEKEQTNRMLIDRETVLASVDAEPGIGKSVATAMALLNYTQKSAVTVLLQGDFQKQTPAFVYRWSLTEEYLKAVKTFTGKAERVLNMTQNQVEDQKHDNKDKVAETQMDAPTPGSLKGPSRKLQFETLWAILNIVSGDVHQTQAIVDLDAVPIITNLLRDCTNSDVLEQGVWALGNIAGDSVQHRDLCISTGSLAEVLKVLEGTTKTSCIRNATWTVSNFCRGTPKPSLEAMLPALPVMARVLHNTDQEVLTDALWTVSYVSDGTERYIQAVLDTGVCQRVVELLSHDSPQVQTPALRTVGNIVTGSDTQTDAVLACEPFPALTRLVASPRMKIRKECCWLLSNICAGTVHQVQQVLNAGFFKVLADAAGDAEHSVKKEVAFALANASEKKSMVQPLVEAGCLNAMQAMLDSHDPKLQDLSVVFATNVCEAVQAHKTSREGTGRWSCFEAVCGWACSGFRSSSPKVLDEQRERERERERERDER